MRFRRRSLVMFAACGAAVLGAMTWLSLELLGLEQRERVARHEAGFHSQIRLALWRMESFVAPLVTQESARPYFQYSAFYSPDLAYTDAFNTMACQGDVYVPSPLLTAEPRYCRLHFQYSGGVYSSPRLPTDELKLNEARRAYFTTEELNRSSVLLAELAALVPPSRLLEFVGSGAKGAEESAAGAGARGAERTQVWAASQAEMQQRQINMRQVVKRQEAEPPTIAGVTELEQSPLMPLWVDRGRGAEADLFLIRWVYVTGDYLIQGVWIDWGALKGDLLSRVNDLVPGAELRPGSTSDGDPDSLASIPAVLVAPAVPPVAAAGMWTPTRVTLMVAWVGVVGAMMAVGLSMRALAELGERRGRFVSAVTHELRTPLTTFCLYSQMLADGMVRSEADRRQYLTTLHRESRRLAKIVENVLCYARLAEVRGSVRTEDVGAGELLGQILPALERRAVEAGMRIDADVGAAAGASVRVDPQTVERILTNLVDNCCKYACPGESEGGAERRVIHVRARAAGGTLDVEVADHGPGIPPRLKGRAFRAFNRASRESVGNTAPGLGLGLSLARGLAREMGGELRIVAAPAGFGLVVRLSIPAGEPEGAAAPEGVVAAS